MATAPVPLPPEPSVTVLEALLSNIPEHGNFTISEVVERTMSDLATGSSRYILELYLWEQGKQTLHQILSSRLRSERQRVASAARHADWRAATEAAAGGDSSKLTPFMSVYEVNGEHFRKHVADMNEGDHAYVAERYTTSERRARMLAAFHDAVAKKLATVGPNATTADVFTEDDYIRLYRSIVK